MIAIARRKPVTATIAIAAIALLGGWSAAATLQPRQPAQPPTPVTGTQYALLVHHSQGALYPNLTGKWYFEDITGRYEPLAMAQRFGLKPGDENLPPRILSAIAAQGWQLVTHTDTAVASMAINNGSSMNEVTHRTEQWWFKKN